MITGFISAEELFNCDSSSSCVYENRFLVNHMANSYNFGLIALHCSSFCKAADANSVALAFIAFHLLTLTALVSTLTSKFRLASFGFS